MLGEARARREVAKTGLWRCVGARGRVNWGKVKRAARILVGGGARQWRAAYLLCARHFSMRKRAGRRENGAEGWRGCLKGRSGGLACCQARLLVIGGDGRWLQRAVGTRVLCSDTT